MVVAMTLRLPKLQQRKWKRRPEILLCPNIPKPMHGMAPRVVLGQAWWDQTRQEAYASTNWRCQACGVHKYRAKSRKWLEGHELYFTDYHAGRMIYLETVPLCHFCHNFIHDGRLNAMLESGDIHHAKFAAIIQHGNRVLAEAGLERPTHAQRDAEIERVLRIGDIPEWGKWRLVLFGKEYPPRYATEDEWRAAYDRPQK